MAASKGQQITVLHVDDEPDFADLTAEFLHRQDDRFTVETKTSPEAALDRLAKNHVDCVVSDHEMPGKNGIEFLEAVREDAPDLPFILFTGKGSEEIASHAVSAGVSDYLQKSFGTDQYAVLANRIRNLVSQRRAESDLEKRIGQQEIVAELGRQAISGVELEQLFDFAVENVAEALGNEYAKVLEYHPERGELLLRSGVGWRDGLVGRASVSDGADSQAGHTLRSEHPVIVDYLPSEDRFSGPPLLTEHDVISGISVIIGDYEDPWGVFGTHSTKRKPFTEHDVTFVQNVANVLASAIGRTTREQELDRTHDLFGKTERIADVGGWEINTETMEVFWSDNLFDILGITNDEEPPLEEALDVYHEADRPMVEEAVEAALESGEPFDVEVRFRRPDAEIRWLRVQGIPEIEDDTVVTLRGAVQDITHRKQYEQLLERQNARLEEFVSVVSHDLRNPLNVAEGRLELAQSECDSDHLEAVDRAHARMKTLIEDLLTLARGGETVTEHGSIDLGGFVERCWGNVETADATLVTDIQTTMPADETRLKQLFENLIRNAVEHGGTDVTVTVGEIEGGFYIEDTGPGIPEAEWDDVLEAGHSTNEEGTGFGLSIVKQIAQAHDWEIHVTDGSEGGARFEVTGVEFTAE